MSKELTDSYIDEEFVRDRILQLVDEKGISDREASLLSGLSGGYINSLRRGTKSAGSMTIDSFLGICNGFNITPLEFFYPKLNYPVLAAKVLEELVRLAPDKKEFNELLSILEAMDYSSLKEVLRIFRNHKRP